MLATRDGGVRELYRVTNAEHSPVFYVMDPQEQLRATLAIEDADMEVGAVYHSHTMTAPRPSETDVKLAQWPGAVFIIVSLANDLDPELRGWMIEDGQVTEEPLEVVDG